MQKKILASLLVTPLAFNAFANIALDNLNSAANWIPGALAGGDYKVIPGENGGYLINAGVSVGTVTQQIKGLLKGTYQIKFTTFENAKLEVTGAGASKVTAVEGADGTFQFDITGGDITVTISAQDEAQAFVFGGASFEIVFDFAAMQTSLLDGLNVTLKDVPEKDETAAAKDLRTQKAALEAECKTLTETVNKLDGGDDMTTEEQLKLYDELKLYNAADPKATEGLAAEVAGYQTDAADYNKAVDEETAKFEAVETNTAAKAALVKGANGLQENLDQFKTMLDKATQPSGIEGDYLGGLFDEDIADVQKDIDAYNKEIETAYADLTKVDITFKPAKTADAIQEEIAGLNTDYEPVAKDIEAYNTFVDVVLPGLEKAYNDATSVLTGLKTYNGEPSSAFNALVQGWKSDVAATYDTAKTDMEKNIKVGTVEGAAAKLADNQAIAEKATGDMSDLASGKKELVEGDGGQNALMTAAQKELKAAQDRIDVLSGLAALEDEQDEIKAQQTALDALKTKVQGAYDTLTLEEATYTTALGTITGALDTMEGTVAGIIEVQDLLDAAKKEINEEIKGTLIEGKFDATFNNIQAAINALEPGADTDAIKNAIADAKASAKTLIDAFEAAQTAVDTMEAAIKPIDELIGKTTVVEGADFDKEEYKTAKDSKYKELNDLLTSFQTDLENAAKAENQACINQAEALQEAVEKSGYADLIAGVKVDFLDKVTTANIAVAGDLLDTIKESAQDKDGKWNVTGVDADTFKDADKAMSDIEAAFNTAKTTTPLDPALYEKIPPMVDKLVPELEKLQTAVQKKVENQEIYDGFTPNMTALGTAIASAYEFNEENNIDPAKTYFANTVIGNPAAATWENTSYAYQLDALQTDLNTALTGQIMADQQDALTAKLSALESALGKDGNVVKQKITDNYNAFNQQQLQSQNVRTTIQKAIDEITEANTKAGGDDALVAKWLEGDEENPGLNVLLSENLPEEDDAVYKLFGQGQSAAQAPTIEQEYAAIAAAANALLEDFNSDGETGFANAISAKNNELIATNSAWTNVLKALNDTYKADSQKFNVFRFQLTNATYSGVVNEMLQDNGTIYGYAAKISELQETVTKFVQEQNTLGHVITQAEFDAKATTPAAQLTADMDGLLQGMLVNMKALAAKFYTDRLAEVNNEIATDQTNMTNAGVNDKLVESTLKEAKALLEGITDADGGQNANAVADAEKAAEDAATDLTGDAATAASDAAYGFSYGQAMDAIANAFDNVVAVIDVNAAAKAQWTLNYEAQQKEIAKLDKELAGYTAPAPTAEQTKAIKDAKDAIAELNENTNTLEVLKANTEELENQVEAIADVVADVKQANLDNKAYQEAEQAYNKALTTLNGDYTDLETYVNGLMVASEVDLTVAKKAIENAEDLVAAGKLIENKANIDAAIAEANAAVATVYATAAGKEITALQTLVSNVNTAYAAAEGAKEKTITDARLAEIQKAVAVIDKAVDNVKNEAGDLIYTPEDKADFRATALEYEAALAGYYQELQSGWTVGSDDKKNPDPDPAATVAAALQAQYDEVSEALTEAQTTLEGCLPAVTESDEKFGEQYDALATKLADLKAAWEADGDLVIATQGNYAAAMTEIAGEIKTISAAVDAAQKEAQKVQDAHDASDAIAATLQTELDGLTAALDAVTETLTGYGVLTEFQYRIARIKEMIASAQEGLDEAKEDYALTDESTLVIKDAVEGDIKSIAYDGAYKYALSEADKAATEIADANKVLTGNIVPESRETLNKQLDALRLTKQDIDNAIQALYEKPATLDEVDDYVAAFEAEAQKAQDIVKEAQAIAESAAENEFVPGDVNNEPDGVVDVVDVQMIATWSGEKLSYDQIKEQYSARQAAAADLNNDAMVNIADVTAVVRLAMDAENGNEGARYAYARGIAGGNDTMDIVPLGTEDGVRRYELNLNNSTEFIAGQFDVILPAGVEFVDAKLAGRTTDHVLNVYYHEGFVTLQIFSFTNAEISGHSGALVVLETRGAGTVEIENALFVDTRNQTYNVQMGSMSFIDTITEGARNLKESIYNVAGQARQSIQRGINIIRRSDGTTTKELHK